MNNCTTHTARPRSLIRCALILLTMACHGTALAQVITETWDVTDPASHYVGVSARIPVNAEQTTLFMPVWTPGSYLVREYSRNLERLEITSPDGQPLEVTQIAKNRWTVDSRGIEQIRVTYQVYAQELSVRTSFVSEEFALLNPATLVLTPENGANWPRRVEVKTPRDWRTESALPQRGSSWAARDLDHLVDSPFVLGRYDTSEFSIGRRTHRISHIGATDWWQLDRANAAVADIVAKQYLFWGSFPDNEPYHFFNLIVDGRGGLEHDHSTVMMSTATQMRNRKQYLDWLGLVSHELFHVWLARALRPKGLQQYDYESENYVDELWLTEGFTRYFSNLLVVRAGLMSPTEYYRRLATMLYQYENTPGRFTRSLEDASRNAWVKHYRPDANSVNSTISYYLGGELLALVLDSELRQRGASLDDLIRQLYAENRNSGFDYDDVVRIASQLAGRNMSEFFQSYVRGTEPLPIDDAFRWFALDLNRSHPETLPGEIVDPTPVDLGVQVDLAGGVTITSIRRDTPAVESGLAPGDQLLGLGGRHVTPESYPQLLATLRAGESVPVLFSRRGRLIEREVVPEAAPPLEWKITSPESPTDAEIRRLRAWLGDSWFAESGQQ